MRKCMRRVAAVTVLVLALAAGAVSVSCEGSDARKAVDDTVQEVTGAKIIEKGEKIKKEIRDLNAQDIERIQKDIEKGVYGEDQ